MIPLIESEAVDTHHCLTHQEFADATALGQITPGPVLISATFVGYRVAGTLGALIATISIFLPSFLMTVAAGSSLRRFRDNQIVQSFLQGVTPAVTGLLVAAAISIGRAVKVNAVVYFRVVDPLRAILEVENYLYATSELSQTTLRSILGEAELDELLSERDRINKRLQEVIDLQTDPWGIKVSTVEVKHLMVTEVQGSRKRRPALSVLERARQQPSLRPRAAGDLHLPLG